MSEALVQISGPLFSPNVTQIVDSWLDESMHEVAERAQDVAVEELDKVLKTQTPFYTTQIKASVSNRASRSNVVVDDSGVVYGPWLAGTGSRNATTRFKGYSHWRRIAERMEQIAPDVALSTLRQLVRKLGG